MSKKKALRLNDPALDIPGLTIRRLSDGKLVFKKEGDHCHYTLHPGHDSGVLDLHRTWETSPATDPASHETIFSIAWTDVAKILAEFSVGLPEELFSLLRPVRLGWMARQRLGIAVIPDDIRSGDITCIKIRRAEATEEELRRRLQIPEYLDDVRHTPNIAALLYDCKRDPPKLFGLFFTYAMGGEIGLRWVKMSDLDHLGRRLEHRLLDLYEKVKSDAKAD